MNKRISSNIETIICFFCYSGTFLNVGPNLSVGHVDQCLYYTESKISGMAQLTLSGIGIEVGISIPAKSKNDWADITYSTAWQLNPTVYVAGGIKGEGSSIKPI